MKKVMFLFFLFSITAFPCKMLVNPGKPFIISNNNIDLCELVGDIINSKLLREFNKNVNHSLEFINKLQGLMKNYNAIIVSENDYNYDIDGNYEYSFSGLFIQVDKKSSSSKAAGGRKINEVAFTSST